MKLIQSFVFTFLLFTIPIFAQDFKAEFNRSWKTNDFEQQGEALFKLAEYNNLKAAKLLMKSLKGIGKLQMILEHKMTKMSKEIDSYNEKDQRKVKLQIELVQLRDKQTEYDYIVDRAGQGIGNFTDPKAIKFLARESLKAKSLALKVSTITAVGKFDSEEATQILLKALKDKSPQVRQIAVLALKTRTPESAFEPLLALLADKAWQVRSSVVETLVKYKNPNAIKPLIDQLKKERGRMVDDIEEALNAYTGESHEGNGHVWQARYTVEKDKWMKGIKKKTEADGEIPTIDNPLRGTKKYYQDIVERKQAVTGKMVAGEGSSVVFVPDAEKIIYLLDFSDSMNDEAPKSLLKAESVIVGESKGITTKIDVLRKKFEKELPKLKEHQHFTIIFFNHKITWWKKELVPATKANINKALSAVKTTKAEGNTNTFGAIEQSFNMAGRGNFDKSYDTSFDTLILVTDGMPTGDYQIMPKTKQDPDKQRKTVLKFLDAVLKLNKLRRIKINTIGIPPDPMNDLLGGLAADSGGSFQYWELK